MSRQRNVRKQEPGYFYFLCTLNLTSIDEIGPYLNAEVPFDKEDESYKWWVEEFLCSTLRVSFEKSLRNPKLVKKYYVTHEIGSESGRYHYHVLIHCKHRVRATAVIKWFNDVEGLSVLGRSKWSADVVHVAAKDFKDVLKNYFCGAQKKRFAEVIGRDNKQKEPIEVPYHGQDLKFPLNKWQKTLLDCLLRDCNQPSSRKVFWLYDENGKIGKTYFAKYMAYWQKAVVVAGGYKDIAYAMASFEEGSVPKVVIFALTRSIEKVGNSPFSLKSVECICDGLLFSTKYDSRQIIWRGSTVLILSNHHPDRETLSGLTSDRWQFLRVNPQTGDLKGKSYNELIR